jgi:acyl-CoA thioester hydrolase
MSTRVDPAGEWAFPVTCPIEIRFRDTDAMGHVNNAVYATYTEVARQAYWRALTQSPDYKRVPFILARIELDFRSPAFVGETLEVGIRADWIGGRSFAFRYAIRDRATRRLVAQALTVMAVYDYESERTYPFPPELRVQMDAFEGRAIPDKPQAERPAPRTTG